MTAKKRSPPGTDAVATFIDFGSLRSIKDRKRKCEPNSCPNDNTAGSYGRLNAIDFEGVSTEAKDF